MAKSEPKAPRVPSAAKDALRLHLPFVVFGVLGLILIFVVVGILVSGLVLSGTVQVTATAIGLTQSLVLFAAIFSLSYVGLHAYAARKAQYEIDRQHRDKAPPLHTKLVVFSRITAGFWTAAILAVGITLGSKSTSSDSSSLGALRADLAACLINCMCMAAVILVLQLSRRPFVLPWITPPAGAKQASAEAESSTASEKEPALETPAHEVAKHAAKSADSLVGSTTLAGEGSTRQGSLRSQHETPRTESPVADIPHSPEASPAPKSTPTERQRLWHEVDEGGRRSPSPMPPPPSPARVKPQPPRRQPHASSHTGARRYRPAPAPVRERERPSPHGPRPTYGLRRGVPAAGYSPYRPGVMDSERNRLLATGDNGEGKKLFNRAVEGLKDPRPPKEDWTHVKVPGSFSW